MLRYSSIFRFQKGLLTACIIVSLAYFSVFRFLSNRGSRLDESLVAVWDKLVEVNLQNRTRLGIDLASINASQKQIEQSVLAMRSASLHAMARVELAADVRQKLSQPFQLLDFEQRRAQMIDGLRKLAGGKKVKLDASLSEGFPEYDIGKGKAPFIWGQLSIVNDVVTAAVVAAPAVIHSVRLLSAVSHPMPDGGKIALEEVRVGIELAGSMESISSFLASLPLTGDELDELNYPVGLRSKSSLFIDKLILKKGTGDPNEVHLDAVVSGFVFNEISS